MSDSPPLRDGQDFLDIAEVIILALDARGRISLINRKGGQVLGYPPQELIGRDWIEEFVPERLREQVREVHRGLIEGREQLAERFENPVVTRSGDERVIAWHNALLRDGEGRISGTLSSGEDVTEQRQVEDELRKSLKDLRDIKQAIDQAAIVAITDRKGIIHYVNDKFCEISKYPREELLGQDHRIVNSGHHSKAFFRDLWGTIGKGRVWRGEIRNRAKDGTIYWVDTTIVPFLDADGKPYQYLAIRSDITARKQIEEELRNREALHQLGQLAAVVAHEVKNPLAGIAGALQIIRGRLPGDSVDREVIGSILSRIDGLNEKVQDLLRYARLRRPEPAPVQLAALIRDTARLLRRDPGLRGVEVEITGDDLQVLADAEQLRDVFQNLLLNAAQAMDGKGRIEVSLSNEDGRCRVAVADNGPGVPGEIRERVFEPFFTTRNYGTGLGLAIARQVVEAHGGWIGLVPADTGGAVVALELPLKPPEPRA